MDNESICDAQRNWLDLPPEITASILSRLGAIEIFTAAEIVCKSWRQICIDPLMWRTIDIHNDDDVLFDTDRMCRKAVDRSCGQVVDFSLKYFCSDELLNYITDRSTGIKRFRLVRCYGITEKRLSGVAQKLPMLEDLEISMCSRLVAPLEVFRRSCPFLKSLKLNDQWSCSHDICDNNARAIAAMPGLQHLQIEGSNLTNKGLIEILDGCRRLESLDLRNCRNLLIDDDLGESIGGATLRPVWACAHTNFLKILPKVVNVPTLKSDVPTLGPRLVTGKELGSFLLSTYLGKYDSYQVSILSFGKLWKLVRKDPIVPFTLFGMHKEWKAEIYDNLNYALVI